MTDWLCIRTEYLYARRQGHSWLKALRIAIAKNAEPLPF